MKVKCSCGAKFEFELRPEMRDNPVKFVCPACGLDASEFVDGLIRQELGQASTPTGVPIPVIPPVAGPAAPGSPRKLAVESSARRNIRLQQAQAVIQEPVSAAGEGAPPCWKHP